MNNYEEVIELVEEFNNSFEKKAKEKNGHALNHAEIVCITEFKSDDDVVYSVSCRRLRKSGTYDEYNILVDGSPISNARFQDSSWLFMNAGYNLSKKTYYA